MSRPVRLVRVLHGALALVAVLLVPSGSEVEAQELSLGLGGGWYQPGGEDFDDTDGGFGYHGSVGVALGDRVELGAGAQWSRHEVGFSTDDYDVLALYLEPRLLLGRTGLLRPYLAARLAWVSQAIAVGGVDRDADGVGAAAELGTALALGPAVALEGGVSLSLLSFGEFETDAGVLEDTDSSGRAVGVRIGLRVRP